MTQVITAAALAEQAASPDPNVGAKGSVFTSDQPTAPGPGLHTAKVDGAPADAAAATERPPTALAKAKAELAAMAAAETGTPAAKPAVAAKPAETVSTEEITKAEAKVAEVAEAKAAIASAEPSAADKFALAQKEFETDPLKALETLGWDIGDIVKKALGKGPDDKPTKEQELAAEVARLASEIKARDEKATKAEAERVSAEARGKVIQAIITDQRFAALKTPENVEAAFAEARSIAEVIAKEKGRKLTDTEGDALTEFYLKKHAAKHANTQTAINTRSERPLKSGLVQPPAGRRSLRDVKRELEALAAQGK